MTQDKLKLKQKTHEVTLLSCYTILGIQELQFLLENHPHEKQRTKNRLNVCSYILSPPPIF